MVKGTVRTEAVEAGALPSGAELCSSSKQLQPLYSFIRSFVLAYGDNIWLADWTLHKAARTPGKYSCQMGNPTAPPNIFAHLKDKSIPGGTLKGPLPN